MFEIFGALGEWPKLLKLRIKCYVIRMWKFVELYKAITILVAIYLLQMLNNSLNQIELPSEAHLTKAMPSIFSIRFNKSIFKCIVRLTHRRKKQIKWNIQNLKKSIYKFYKFQWNSRKVICVTFIKKAIAFEIPRYN